MYATRDNTKDKHEIRYCSTKDIYVRRMQTGEDSQADTINSMSTACDPLDAYYYCHNTSHSNCLYPPPLTNTGMPAIGGVLPPQQEITPPPSAIENFPINNTSKSSVLKHSELACPTAEFTR